MIEVPAAVVGQYRHWSLYNSPYDAHDRGCAIDCYPAGDRAPSPVAGTVVETQTVRAPPRPYAADHDHLIVIDTRDRPPGAPDYRTADGGAPLARVMHVDPAVEAGDQVTVGDDLGALVRAGFFAPWVDTHIHLGFRDRDANPIRAGGSLPLCVGVDPVAMDWDGRGTVVEAGETYAVLDRPVHPAPGERFAGIATDEGAAIVDGGLPHYEGGGRLPTDAGDVPDSTTLSLLGTTVGTAAPRTVGWEAVTVTVDGEPITGLSLFPTREAVGAKLVCPDRPLAVGTDVKVRIEPTGGDPQAG